MQATAKIFQSGNSQAIRLPKAFRFDASVREIELRKNELTGELTFSPIDAEAQRRARLEALFAQIEALPPVDDDFLTHRTHRLDDTVRNPFSDLAADKAP